MLWLQRPPRLHAELNDDGSANARGISDPPHSLRAAPCTTQPRPERLHAQRVRMRTGHRVRRACGKGGSQGWTVQVVRRVRAREVRVLFVSPEKLMSDSFEALVRTFPPVRAHRSSLLPAPHPTHPPDCAPTGMPYANGLRRPHSAGFKAWRSA